jgi:hypothetical protein
LLRPDWPEFSLFLPERRYQVRSVMAGKAVSYGRERHSSAANSIGISGGCYQCADKIFSGALCAFAYFRQKKRIT